MKNNNLIKFRELVNRSFTWSFFLRWHRGRYRCERNSVAELFQNRSRRSFQLAEFWSFLSGPGRLDPPDRSIRSPNMQSWRCILEDFPRARCNGHCLQAGRLWSSKWLVDSSSSSPRVAIRGSSGRFWTKLTGIEK